MPASDLHLNRRSFLQAGAAGALMMGGMGAQAATPPQNTFTLNGRLPEKVFGRTGHTLPVFGHGGSAMIEGDIAKYGLDLLSVEDRVKFVRDGYNQGIRYFDTARIYGESENIMGEALKDVREDVFIASKVMVWKTEDVRSSVEKSLEALGTDYVDSMQIHGPVVERLGYDGCMPQYEELVKLQQEGLIRHIGLTGHSRFENMYQLIDTGLFDTVLIEFGYFRKGLNTRHSDTSLEWRQACVARATELNMGVVAMKVLSAMIFGHNAKNIVPDYPQEKLAQLPGAAIRYVYSDPRVHIINLGISLPGDIGANMKIFTEDLSFTNEDRLLLADFSAKAYQHEYVRDLKVV